MDKALREEKLCHLTIAYISIDVAIDCLIDRKASKEVINELLKAEERIKSQIAANADALL